MKDMSKTENKVARPQYYERLVKIKITHANGIAGCGNCGDVVEVSELVARNFIGQGLAALAEFDKENKEK